jgi:hypothetical protein
LPLIGSSPDGGIFAYTPGPAKASIDPFRPTLTVAPAADTLEIPDPPARRWPMGVGVPFLFDLPDELPSKARPFPLEMAGTPSATGVAFLPPLVQFAEVRVVRGSNRDAASRWPILYSKMKPKTSLAAIIFGSAGLFLGLVAPDCVTRLAAWKEDRRWKRRALV